MSTRIEQVDTRDTAEATLRALHDLYLERDAEQLPSDPPMPYQARIADWRHLHDHELIPRWILWDGSRVVATSGAAMDRMQNLENGFGWVYVRREQRGAGLGRRIAGPMLDAVAAERRTRFACQIVDGRPEEAITRRAGMRAAYGEKRSRLVVGEVDRPLMRGWVTRAAERAADYEALFVKSPMSDELVGPFCELTQVMNTAPREDFEEEDQVVTPEMWRDIEEKQALRSTELLTCIARHKPSGRLVGYTTLAFERLQPDQAWQWDTGVDPEHRNQGIGHWLKAAMIERLFDDYPAVKRIDTFNAGSNQPMLNINIEMGFRPILSLTTWQGNLATIRERLVV